MPAKHYHSLDELDDLEEAAIECTSSDRVEALRIVAPIFNRNNLDYGLIGGTNFYLRGSARSTSDVDIAVSGHWSLAQVLDMLVHDERITRPAPSKPLLWVSGVARILVLVSNMKETQLVQVDLKRQTASTHDFAIETEVTMVPPPVTNVAPPETETETEVIPIRFFKIAPLVKLKLHAFYIREEYKDYHDLLFICKDQKMSRLVREAAVLGSQKGEGGGVYGRGEYYSYEERLMFLERVVEDNPADEDIVKNVLGLDGNGDIR